MNQSSFAPCAPMYVKHLLQPIYSNTCPCFCRLAHLPSVLSTPSLGGHTLRHAHAGGLGKTSSCHVVRLKRSSMATVVPILAAKAGPIGAAPVRHWPVSMECRCIIFETGWVAAQQLVHQSQQRSADSGHVGGICDEVGPQQKCRFSFSCIDRQLGSASAARTDHQVEFQLHRQTIGFSFSCTDRQLDAASAARTDHRASQQPFGPTPQPEHRTVKVCMAFY